MVQESVCFAKNHNAKSTQTGGRGHEAVQPCRGALLRLLPLPTTQRRLHVGDAPVLRSCVRTAVEAPVFTLPPLAAISQWCLQLPSAIRRPAHYKIRTEIGEAGLTSPASTQARHPLMEQRCFASLFGYPLQAQTQQRLHA